VNDSGRRAGTTARGPLDHVWMLQNARSEHSSDQHDEGARAARRARLRTGDRWHYCFAAAQVATAADRVRRSFVLSDRSRSATNDLLEFVDRRHACDEKVDPRGRVDVLVEGGVELCGARVDGSVCLTSRWPCTERPCCGGVCVVVEVEADAALILVADMRVPERRISDERFASTT
jgi:hypothetical protein